MKREKDTLIKIEINKMVDFKAKLNSASIEKKIDPVEIYENLDRKSAAGPLRVSQETILKKWFNEKQDNRDIVVKLHTGEGKTLIGLLMLLSKLNSSNKPAVYLCPNIYLAEQVCQEATKFGIPYCTIEADREIPDDLLSSKKILITHAQKLFNGKTRFGLNNSSISVGSIVLDDSHACIDSIKSSFTITLPKGHNAYNKILSLFEDDLRNQGEGSFLDLQSKEYGTLMPIPYWSWIERKDEVTKILSSYSDDDCISFTWPLIKDIVSKCQAYISGKEIEITPYLIPVENFGTFATAGQRILMSATTQDDSFFIKGLDFSIDSVENPLVSIVQKWSGEKMLLIPSLIDGELDREIIVDKFAPPSEKNYGVVAILTSPRLARSYEMLGCDVATSGTIFKKITDLKQGHYSDTLVIVNRYDGIDLPDEACRILIVDSMPYLNTLSERYEEACRLDSDVVNVKYAQKIEQGLGRSVRGEKDYTVILVIGTDLVKFIKSSKTSNFFSEQTRKQIEIGKTIAELAKDDLKVAEPFNVLMALIDQSIKRDENWKAFYKKEMDKIEGDKKKTEIYNILQIEKKAERSNFLDEYEDAVSAMQGLIDSLDEGTEKGWYLQALARYKYNLSKVDSNTTQKSAFKNNYQLLKPKDGISYKKIEYINGNRIEKIKDFQMKFTSFDELSLEVDAILENLTFGVEAEKFEGALKEVGSLLGFVSQRPDKEFRKGPDNLWGGVDGKYFLFECKNEVEESRSEINKHEAGQMNSHCGWFDAQYGNISVKRILIIPTKNLSYHANFTHDVQIMRKNMLRELKSNIKSFIKEFKKYKLNELGDEKIQAFIDANKLSIDNLLNDYSENYYHRAS